MHSPFGNANRYESTLVIRPRQADETGFKAQSIGAKCVISYRFHLARFSHPARIIRSRGLLLVNYPAIHISFRQGFLRNGTARGIVGLRRTLGANHATAEEEGT
jgi:hypothetical protein